MDNTGNPLDFLSVQLGSAGRGAGVLADTFFFRNGSLILVDENGLFWRIKIVIQGDGVTAALQLEQVTI